MPGEQLAAERNQARAKFKNFIVRGVFTYPTVRSKTFLLHKKLDLQNY